MSFILSFLGPLLGKISPKMWLYGLVAAALGVMLWAGWSHYTGLVEDNATLSANAVKLETAVEQQQKTVDAALKGIDRWKKSQRKLMRNFKELRRVTYQAGEEKRRINELFAKHDIGKLARSKPGLIEQRVNRGSARIARLLSCATGARNLCSSD